MSKSDSSNIKIRVYTANSLYKQGLEGFKNTNILKEQQGTTPLVIAGYTAARSQLTEALLFGNTESCAALSYFNQEGIGGVKSQYNQKLFLTIGSKLRNQKCTSTLTNLQNNNCDVEREANIWVNHINTYKRDLDKEITTPELAASSTFLENALKQNNISLEAYNNHILIVKSKEEIAASYNPPPTPKPAANHYDPYSYNKNTTSPTYYTTPEQQKYNTKPLGDIKSEKSTCDIL